MTPTTHLGPVGQRISAKLVQAFAPASLDVIDESHHHAGHSGARADGESHFRVVIVASLPRQIAGRTSTAWSMPPWQMSCGKRVHALAIQASAP